jgi:hypothetical protein
MSQDRYEPILYEVERGRAPITLNRPKSRNALSVALLADALGEAVVDRDAPFGDGRARFDEPKARPILPTPHGRC